MNPRNAMETVIAAARAHAEYIDTDGSRSAEERAEHDALFEAIDIVTKVDAPAGMGMHIVVAGGPVDGFNYIGPFKTRTEAANWARTTELGTEWWVVPIEPTDLDEDA